MIGKKPDHCYRPSNGTEGVMFEENFCQQCIHEKFMHSQKHGDKQCAIFNEAYLEDWVREWVYDENGKPTCTSFVKWDWGSDDELGGFTEPPEIIPDDPNQLVLPFEIDALLENIIQEHELQEEVA